MTDLDENVTPEPAPDVDPQSVDIDPSPEEYFVLSRVDGSMTIAQICKTSGLGPDKTMQCIETLHRHGLIELPGHTPEPDSASSGADGATAKSEPDEDDSNADKPQQTSVEEAIRRRFPVSFSDFDFDAELLEQSVEIDDDFKRELLFVSRQLEDVDHYQLLGVERDVERRDLRKAYFRMSKRYHPDRFYQKILGDYEKMVESIFQRVTKAYQTLNNEQKRQQYDAGLDARHPNQSGHGASPRNATPASRRSETREEMKGDRKKEMAYKVMVQRSDKALRQDRVAEAIKGYRKALSLRRNADLALRVARSLLERGEHLDDATSFARAAQKIADSPAPALKLIGAIYEEKESIDDALYHYKMALDAGDDPEIKQRIERLESQ